jgi:hypothetical protein
MTGISGSQSLGRFVAHDGGCDAVMGAATDVVAVTVTPAAMDVGADDPVQAIK